RDATEEELTGMEEEFDLHPLAVEDARHGHQRPKIEEYGDLLFVVVNTVEVVGDELKVGEVDIFVGRNFVLSVRQHSEQGFLGVRARAEREPELLRNGAGYVLYALLDAVVDRYFPVLDAVETELAPHHRACQGIKNTGKKPIGIFMPPMTTLTSTMVRAPLRRPQKAPSSTPSPSTSVSTCLRLKPSTLRTAISAMRSRTVMLMALATITVIT